MRKIAPFKKIILYLLLTALSLICLMPLYWLFRSSVMDMASIFIFPPLWVPQEWQWVNYIDVFKIVSFGRYFLNTLTIVAFVLTGTLFTASLCAYSFARFRWPLRNLMFTLVIATMMLPYAVTIIPVYLGWKALGFTNSYVPLIVPAWLGGGSFNIFLLRQFFLTIPKTYDEAAFIDGAGYWKIYTMILIPMLKPALIVVALFTFMATWNDFLAPLIYLSDEKRYTLALGLQSLKGLYNAQWHLLMAGSMVQIVPVVTLFFVGQRYFIKGVNLGGLKG